MAFTESEIEQVREQVGDIAAVLERNGFNSRKGRILCPNPEHGDKKPGSVVILPPGTRGTETLYCHVCFYTDDNIGLARLLGEVVIFPVKSENKQAGVRRRLRPWRMPRTRKQIQQATRLRDKLMLDSSIEMEWLFARKVATLFFEEGAVQREIDRNREWLEEEGCDIQRIQALSDRLGQYAFKHFGNPDDMGDMKAWRRWVAQAVVELEA